jgi:hypothetical protein
VPVQAASDCRSAPSESFTGSGPAAILGRRNSGLRRLACYSPQFANPAPHHPWRDFPGAPLLARFILAEEGLMPRTV